MTTSQLPLAMELTHMVMRFKLLLLVQVLKHLESTILTYPCVLRMVQLQDFGSVSNTSQPLCKTPMEDQDSINTEKCNGGQSLDLLILLTPTMALWLGKQTITSGLALLLLHLHSPPSLLSPLPSLHEKRKTLHV